MVAQFPAAGAEPGKVMSWESDIWSCAKPRRLITTATEDYRLSIWGTLDRLSNEGQVSFSASPAAAADCFPPSDQPPAQNVHRSASSRYTERTSARPRASS